MNARCEFKVRNVSTTEYYYYYYYYYHCWKHLKINGSNGTVDCTDSGDAGVGMAVQRTKWSWSKFFPLVWSNSV